MIGSSLRGSLLGSRGLSVSAGTSGIPFARGRVGRVPHRQLGSMPEIEEVLEPIVLGEDTQAVTWATHGGFLFRGGEGNVLPEESDQSNGTFSQ